MRIMLTLLTLAIVAIGIAITTAHAGGYCSTYCGPRDRNGAQQCTTRCQ